MSILALASVTAADQLTVVQEKAPMFKEPNISSPIIKYLEKNSQVNLLAAEDSFYLVSFGGFEGWVIPYSVRRNETDTVTATQKQPETVPGPEQQKSQADLASGRYLVVSNRYANVREGPGLNFKIIGKVNQGDRLEKFIRRGDWYRVRLPDSKIGFIFYQLVKEPPEAAGAAVESSVAGTMAQSADLTERVDKLEKEVHELRQALSQLQAAMVTSQGGSATGTSAFSIPASRNIAPEAAKRAIIGNRATRVYHLPESVYYDKIPEEFRVIFSSEEEARKAGYTKSIK